MTPRHLAALACLSVAALGAGCHRPSAPTRVLRVCADPNNLPFSNRSGEGFENRIANLLAADRHAGLDYTWWAQRRGFIRNTLTAGACDVVIGVPAGLEMTLTTHRYYQSSYVFVSRRDRGLDLASFDDPRLPSLRIGVQMIGDDFNNSPPAHALSRRGIVRNVVGYSVYGNYADPSPLSAIVDAVDQGAIDAAVVWGPAGGYFARRAAHPLDVHPVSPRVDAASLPFVFDIAMAVRPGDTRLQNELNDFIARRQSDIDAILSDYGVPRVEGT
jgi:mxaJ protein